MITKSQAFYVSALDPSCPAKSKEPVLPDLDKADAVVIGVLRKIELHQRNEILP